MIPADGFFFALVLLGGVCAAAVWIAFWSRHQFRFVDRDADRIRRSWAIGGVFLAALLIAFPPQRRAADWKDRDTGRAARDPEALDRQRFGWAPSYRWIGWAGSEVRRDVVPGLRDETSPRARWAVDGCFLACELAGLTLFLLPFLMATRPGDPRGS